jgi:dephospho-CoA kinase
LVAIVVVGMPGSGKDVFVKAAVGMGFNRIGMGDAVRRFAAQAGLDEGDVSIGSFADSERKAHGPGIWAERTLAMMPPGDVVIDGSRSMEEISLFRERLGSGLVVVAIEASPETRLSRLRQRRRGDDPLTPEDFSRRDSRELSWGIGEAISRADVRLLNESDMASFQAECQRTLGRLLGAESKVFNR